MGADILFQASDQHLTVERRMGPPRTKDVEPRGWPHFAVASNTDLLDCVQAARFGTGRTVEFKVFVQLAQTVPNTGKIGMTTPLAASRRCRPEGSERRRRPFENDRNSMLSTVVVAPGLLAHLWPFKARNACGVCPALAPELARGASSQVGRANRRGIVAHRVSHVHRTVAAACLCGGNITQNLTNRRMFGTMSHVLKMSRHGSIEVSK